jgi:predicted Fe-Mo cluster-binding NifX family protein
MIIAMPIKTPSSDAALAPLFGNAKHFAIINENKEINIQNMEQSGGRDVARTLIASNVEILITSHLGMNPFVLLKSYGMKIYFAGDNRITIHEALGAFHTDKLIEVTSENFDQLLGDHLHLSHDHSDAGLGCSNGCGTDKHAKL